MKFDKHSWIKNALRRASFKWPGRYNSKLAARVSRGKYKCGECQGIFRDKEVQLDHKNPVIDVTTGFVDWNTFIERLFVPESGFSVLCVDCHQKKSTEENALRREVKKSIDKSDEEE